MPADATTAREVTVVLGPRDRRRGSCTKPDDIAKALTNDTAHYTPTVLHQPDQLLARLWGRPPGDVDRLGRPHALPVGR